jgi:Family of unknown function (DUF6527)
MGALGSKMRTVADCVGTAVAFWCPGCGESHVVRVTGQGAWEYSGDIEAPTFRPSILVTNGHYSPGHKGDVCWCTYNAVANPPTAFRCMRCHSFITDGKIQFLDDCTHELAGKTVLLPDWPKIGDPAHVG